jgi:hypothetical protein
VNSPEQESTENLAKKLGLYIKLSDIEARPEEPDERKSRLEKEEREHKLKIWKDKITYFGACTIISLLFGFSGFIVLSSTSTEGDKNLARAVITAISSAVIIYLFGRNNPT